MRPLRYALSSMLMVLLSVGPLPTQTTTVNVEREQTISGKKHFTGGISIDTCATDPPSGACSPSGTSHDFCVDDTNSRLYGCIGAVWVNLSSAAGGTPGGSSTQVQFNSAGAFAGDAGMVYTAASDLLTVGATTVTGNAKFSGGGVHASGNARLFVVDAAGHAEFTTINAAVTAAAQTGGLCTTALPCIIAIQPGTYTEMVQLSSAANHLTLGNPAGDKFDNIHFVGMGASPEDVIWTFSAGQPLVQSSANPTASPNIFMVSTDTTGTQVTNLMWVDSVTGTNVASFYSTDSTNSGDTILRNIHFRDTSDCDAFSTYICSRGKLRMFDNIIERTTTGTSSTMCFAATIDADCDYEVDGNTYLMKGDKLGIWNMEPNSAGNNGRYRFLVRNSHAKITNPSNVNNAEYKIVEGGPTGAAYDSVMQIRSSFFEIEAGTIATATATPFDWQINLDPTSPITGYISNGLELYDTGTRVNGEAVTGTLTATGYNIDAPGISQAVNQETRLHLHDTQMAVITNTAIAGTRNGMNLDTAAYYANTDRPMVHLTGDNVVTLTHGTNDIAYAGTAAESDFHPHDGWFGKWSKQLIPPTQAGAISGACTGLGGVRTRNTDGSASISVCDSAGNWETVVGSGDSVSVDGGTVVDPNFDDGGDINFATTGSPATVTATVKANSVALTTDTTGDYVASVAESTALDCTGTGEGAAVSCGLDATEIGNTTFGTGSSIAWTFNAGATDPVLTFTSALTDVSTPVTATSFTADDPGDNLRGLELTDNTTNCADPAAGNTSLCAIGGIPRMRDTAGSTLPIVTGSGVATHGVAFWGDQDDAAFDTGTEVCTARGMTCVGAAELTGTELASCATVATGSTSGWFLAFCR